MRDRILSEAMHLAASRGFEATSIQAIADAVGIRKQSLLYHFSSKEILHLYKYVFCLLEALVTC